MTQAGLRTEDMKLFPIDFDEIQNRELEFEDSAFYSYFADSQMLCIVFEEPSIEAPFKDNKLLGFKRIIFSQDFIEKSVKPIWEKIRELIFGNKLENVVSVYKKTGKPQINPKTGTIKAAPNFPKSADGNIFVRGSSKDSTVKPEDVNGVRMYRQYIWIKGSYIADCLSRSDYL